MTNLTSDCLPDFLKFWKLDHSDTGICLANANALIGCIRQFCLKGQQL